MSRNVWRIASERVGGWRDYRDLAVDPETDLWQRMHLAGFKFQGVPRLTAVKFPASGRKDVYKKRSSHEQQQWTDRIRSEPNLEALELGRLLLVMDVPVPPAAISVLFQSLLGEASSGSVRWRLLFKIRSLLSLGRLQPPENGAVIRRIRQFKGAQSAN